MTFGEAFPGIVGLVVAGAGYIYYRVELHRRARRRRERGITPAE